MNQQEFIDKYGDEEVKFHSYWKYSFTFNNPNVVVSIGGHSDDIYRLDVVSNRKIKIKDLLIDWEDFDYVITQDLIIKEITE